MTIQDLLDLVEEALASCNDVTDYERIPDDNQTIGIIDSEGNEFFLRVEN